MKMFWCLLVGIGMSLGSLGCDGGDEVATESATDAKIETNAVTVASGPRPVPERAEEVEPLTGGPAPVATLMTPSGESVSLETLYGERETVLIFYRGGWCPFCNEHLSELIDTQARLNELGFQILAISPDRPEKLKTANDEYDYGYQLLSDSSMTLSKAFGLAFRVDAATYEKYIGYGIDLEDASGATHHLLPVPAVYLIDREGQIRFAHWDADYKQRLSPERLLEEAEKLTR